MTNLRIFGMMQNVCIECLRNRFILIAAIVGLLSFKHSQAQVNVSVNIVSQPLWGPVSYDYVEYYYLPEADVFYYVPSNQFIYWSAGSWMFARSLPVIYHVDLYRTYKVVVNQPRPYMQHQVYITKYGKYKSVRSKQVVIRDSRDKKYYVVKGHSGHTKVKAAKSGPSKSAVVKPGGSKSGVSKPHNSQPSVAKPSGIKSGGSKPAGTKSGNTKPASSNPKSPKANGSSGKGQKNH